MPEQQDSPCLQLHPSSPDQFYMPAASCNAVQLPACSFIPHRRTGSTCLQLPAVLCSAASCLQLYPSSPDRFHLPAASCSAVQLPACNFIPYRRTSPGRRTRSRRRGQLRSRPLLRVQPPLARSGDWGGPCGGLSSSTVDVFIYIRNPALHKYGACRAVNPCKVCEKSARVWLKKCASCFGIN